MANEGNPNFLVDVENSTQAQVVEKVPVDQDLKDLTFLSVMYGQEMQKRMDRKVGVDYKGVRQSIRHVTGGVNYRFPIDKFLPEVGGTAFGDQELDTTVVETLDTGEFSLSRYYRPYGWNQDEDLANSGPMAFVNLMTHRRGKAKDGIRYDIMRDLMGDGSRKEFSLDGLQAMIDNANEYEGIDRVTNAFWRAVEIAVGGQFEAEGDDSLQDVIDRVSVGQGMARPDSIWGPRNIWNSWNNRLADHLRFSMKEVGNWPTNSRNVMFNEVPFFWTQENPVGTLFIINSDYLYLAAHSRNDMRWTPVQSTPSQPWTYTGFVACSCQLVCTSGVRHAKMTGVTP